MRTWTKSACVVLAWSILSVALMVIGMTGSVHPAQANTRTASRTEVILTSIKSAAAPAAPAAPAVTGTSPATMYVVQPGDTLSGIAARFGIQGGWPPLYTSNLKAIGWNPNVLHPGTALVLPGPARARYTVSAGDTLSGIAASLRVRGGWPALYAANRRVIGSDPNALQPGTVLRLPGVAAAPHTSGVTPGKRPARPQAPAPARHRHHRVTAAASAPAGMPRWLKTMLVALGLLILVALLAEPVLAALRAGGKRRSRPPNRARPALPGSSAVRQPPRNGSASSSPTTIGSS